MIKQSERPMLSVSCMGKVGLDAAAQPDPSQLLATITWCWHVSPRPPSSVEGHRKSTAPAAASGNSGEAGCHGQKHNKSISEQEDRLTGCT